MKIKLLILSLLLLPNLLRAGEAPHEIYNRICGTDPNCLMCIGTGGYDNDIPTLDLCGDYGVFNADLNVPKANGDSITGIYDNAQRRKVCKIKTGQKECTLKSTSPETKKIIKFRYVWSGDFGYKDVDAIKAADDKEGIASIGIDNNTFDVTFYQNTNKSPKTSTINLLQEINKTVNYRIDKDELRKATLTFTYRTIHWHGFLENSMKESEDKNISMIIGKTPYLAIHHWGIFKNPVITIDVPTMVQHTVNTVTCPIDSSLPCVSENDGASYFCSATECGVFTSDNITPEKNEPTDTTPESDNTSDNGTCEEDMKIYLFPGKKLECRQEGLTMLSNNLTSPNQCVRQENLSNEVKESLLGGLNKTFDKLKKIFNPLGDAVLGDWAALTNPISAVIKMYEVLGELIIKNLAEEPKPEEKNLSFLRSSYGEDGACKKVGEYCSDWADSTMHGYDKKNDKYIDFSKCNRKSSMYCCYDSPIAKAFNVAARDQLPKYINWGENLEFVNKITKFKTPAPNCRGITVDELSKINLESPEFKNDMKKYVEDVLLPTLSKDGGMLDPKRLTDLQQKMQEDIMKSYD